MPKNRNMAEVLLITALTGMLGALVAVFFNAICKTAGCLAYVDVCHNIESVFIVVSVVVYLLSIVLIDV